MLEHTMAMPSTITQINLNRDSGLLAVVCDDLVVRLVDIETRRIVREMAGFRGRVLDLVSRMKCLPDNGQLTLLFRHSLPIPDGLLRHRSIRSCGHTMFLPVNW
jgi:hypothetical protein